MTTAAPVSIAASVPGSAPIFFVVPVIPDDGSVENVFYYAQAGSDQYWEKISPKDLDARRGGGDANGVMLFQLSVTADPLPSACLFDANRFMVIPVVPHTTRGVILVFSKQSTGKSPTPVFELIATTDPEIKNGVGK